MEANSGAKSRASMLPMAANIGSSEMLGLDISLHHGQHPLAQQHGHPTPFAAQRHDAALGHSHSPQQQQQQQLGHSVAGSSKRKQQPQSSLTLPHQELQLPTSFGGERDVGTATAAVPVSAAPSPSPTSPPPWHRMKWTDNMVRLLIMIVYCVGDDGNTTADHGDQQSASGGTRGKRAPTASSASTTSAAAGLVLQKKGKWKSVSRAMMEKGFCVSPQQCEDKFNDLNKRYKRVNELLGRGTACRVVENQALLDSMDHLSSKAKEEARKLLNSKHLYFREMCAYHNGGVGGGSSGCASGLPDSSPSSAPSQLPQPQSSPLPSQDCFHHPSEPAMNFSREALFGASGGQSSGSMFSGANEEDDEGKDQTDNIDDGHIGDYYEEIEEEDGEYNDDGDDEEEADKERHQQHHKRHKDDEKKNKLIARPTSPLSASPPLSLSLSSSMSVPTDQWRCNLLGPLASIGGEQQQRQWLRRKAAELEEQRVGYLGRALELERQRFKWIRYSSLKEREMERMKLDHESRRLQNDRMLLLLRQKEQELISSTDAAAARDEHLHHQNLQLH